MNEEQRPEETESSPKLDKSSQRKLKLFMLAMAGGLVLLTALNMN